MSLEYFANVAEVIGVILVIASLIYVAKQLRQNTNAVRAQSRQSVLAASQAELLMTIERPSITVYLGSSESLSKEEQASVASYLFAIFRAREFAWLQHNNGVIDDTQWSTELAVLLFFIDSQRVRDWWENVGQSAYGVEFSAFVNSLCKKHALTNTTFNAMVSWADLGNDH